MEQQSIPVRPQLCRCQDIEPAVASVRSVLLRRHDVRTSGEKIPNLRAAFNHAERAVWATRLGQHGHQEQDEEALYYAMVEVAVAALSVLDHLERPTP